MKINSPILMLACTSLVAGCEQSHELTSPSPNLEEGSTESWVTRLSQADELPVQTPTPVGEESIRSWTQTAELTARDSGPWMFGEWVSISDEVAVVGAREGDFSQDVCSVYFFAHREDGSWEQTQKVSFRDDETSVECQSVAVSGEFAAVGASYSGGNTYTFGVVYVFERLSDGVWTEVALLSDLEINSFGRSLALFEKQLIVGGAGAACVFERDTDGTWHRTATLVPEPDSVGADFGVSVSIDRDRALVGAETSFDSAPAYVFERQDDGSWLQTAQLVPADRAYQHLFGTQVALSGRRALVGTNWSDANDSFGAAYVFEQQDDESWLETATLEPAGARTGDFMVNVSLSGERAAVGTLGTTNHSRWSDATWIFERQADGSWKESSTLAVDGIQGRYLFGASVSLDGDRVIVGAPCDWDANSRDPGAVYVFER